MAFHCSMLLNWLATCLIVLASRSAHAVPPTPDSELVVDLGYARYQGSHDNSSGLNAWSYMRYAAPPTGNNRWRAPQPPQDNRTAVIQADHYISRCPQGNNAPSYASFDYAGSEDCLYLSVYSPPNAINLPVLFYIHGGGYGTGDGRGNAVSQLQSYANNSFVSVIIQYRLAAFGFLASNDVHDHGTLNAGLLDQHFALEWVQEHIEKFGGNPRKVTILGQSAGAGSVMCQAMAYGGKQGTNLFQQGIASSPFTPAQNHYSDHLPNEYYLQFAKRAGCYSGDVKKRPAPSDGNILACLRKADTDTLQSAGSFISSNATGLPFGSWAFVPVTDDDFLQTTPSQQLPLGRLNGGRILTSHNADDGEGFVTPNITTKRDFDTWLTGEYPLLTKQQIHDINHEYYPLKNESDVPFATCGDCDGPTAVNVGSWAVGNRQRAIDLYSEVTFDCPSYWLAEGMNVKHGRGYKYQFSTPPGQHGLDLAPDGLAPCPNIFSAGIQPDFCKALHTSWLNFFFTGDPSISNAIANGASSPTPDAPSPASHWPVFGLADSSSLRMLNWNQTQGSAAHNNITLANAYPWEGGRGERCDFWRRVGYPS